MPNIQTPNSAATDGFPALTRAAIVPLGPDDSRRVIRERVRLLAARGYNTLVAPLLREGELMLKPARAGSPFPYTGPFVELLDELQEHFRGSTWILVDPLSAGAAGSGRMGSLARKHGDWLMRNSQGKLAPLGATGGDDPLFSWVGREFRRFLGDVLVTLAEKVPFGGIAMDLRAYPGETETPERWYCCAWESQQRAEEALRIDFEKLLLEGSREQVERWRLWVRSELRVFVEGISARVHVARRDIGWKILVPPGTSGGLESAPWLPWLTEGSVDELIADCSDSATPLPALVEEYDRATSRRPLIMPAYANEETLRAAAPRALAASSPGFLVLSPSLVGTNPLPTTEPSWANAGAIEDYPLEAATALAEYLETQLGPEHKLGRFYRRVHQYLIDFTPDARLLDQMRERIEGMEARLRAGEISFPEGRENLRRELDLINRLLAIVQAPPASF